MHSLSLQTTSPGPLRQMENKVTKIFFFLYNIECKKKKSVSVLGALR